MNKYYLKSFISLFTSLFFIEILFKVICFNSLFDFELFRIFLFTISTSSILSYVFTFFKPLINKILILVTTFIMGIYTLLEINFKNFMGNFMSFSMVFKGGNANRISSEVITFITNIKPLYFLCLLPFAILLILFIRNRLEYVKRNKKENIIMFLSIIVFYVLSLTTLLYTPQNQIKNNKELYETPNLIDVALKEFGSLRFLSRDLIYAIKDEEDTVDITPIVPVVKTDYSRDIDDDSWKELIANEKNSVIKNLDEYYINQNITQKNDYTGYFKGKNLILIMVEAFDMAAIDKDLTPTLYKLKEEGWYFNNYYAPKYSCTTGESEFIAETSIIPSIPVCTPHTYANNTYSTSIFNLFKNSRYDVSSYHSYTDKYYPRTILHKNMGSTFYDANALNISIANGWPSDIELMQKSYEKYRESEQFFSFVITVSMHFTYDKDSQTTIKNWSMVKSLNTGTSMKRYLAKAIEFDKSMEYLLNALKDDDKLDDTVIAIFGDHHPYNLNFDYINERSEVDRYADLNEDLMPFIIYNSASTSKVISKTSSTFDILPTLANLFDLSYDPRYYVGKDVFSDDETIVIFPTGSWITDKAIYFASKNKYKLLSDDVDEDYVAKTNKIVSDKFTISENTLKKDYFKYRYNNQ